VGVIAEHDVIECKVQLLRELVEKSAAMRNGERKEGGSMLVLVWGVGWGG